MPSAEWEDLLPDPQRSWMKAYFDLPSDKVTDTMVAITDIYDHKITKPLKFVQERNINFPHETLVSALGASDSSIKTRIVMLVHDGRNGLDRDMVRTLWQEYHLDPVFLMTHFFWDFKNHFRSNAPKTLSSTLVHDEPISLLPSEKYLLLDYNGAQFGAIIPDAMTPRTGKNSLQSYCNVVVVLFASARLWVPTGDHGKHQFLQINENDLQQPLVNHANVYLQPLLYLDPSSRIHADRHPIEYIVPFALLINEEYGFQLRRLRQEVNHRAFPLDPRIDWVDDFLTNRWTHFLRLQMHMTRTKEAIYHFTSPQKFKSLETLQSLKQHYADLENQFSQFEGWITFIAQEAAAKEGVKQMEISNNIATSARAIAIMAYIFVPLAFAISFFGMNLTMFGNQDVKPKIFIAVTVSIWMTGVASAYVIYRIWGRYEKRWGAKQRMEGDKVKNESHHDLEKQAL